MRTWRNLGTGSLAGLGTALSLALLLSACGASLDSGVTPTSSPQTPALPSASPSASATASASACVSPGDTEATYQLAGAQILAGNLQIKDTTVGTGATAADGDKIKVTYVGSLPDGTVFDRSTNDDGGKPISFTLATGKVIAGWVEGIAGMKVGGTRELVIPAALAYGCTADGKIPADSTLIFTVQLVAVS
ncbi:MAG: FKBP-type peptidyl-prolyl cis-trans isomerase [Candidatus Dormiibacterota bacterium]